MSSGVVFVAITIFLVSGRLGLLRVATSSGVTAFGGFWPFNFISEPRSKGAPESGVKAAKGGGGLPSSPKAPLSKRRRNKKGVVGLFLGFFDFWGFLGLLRGVDLVAGQKLLAVIAGAVFGRLDPPPVLWRHNLNVEVKTLKAHISAPGLHIGPALDVFKGKEVLQRLFDRQLVGHFALSCFELL
jgi:hypothetical protein